MSTILPIVMPKWGLSMEEGMLTEWSVDDGASITVGQEIMDIETDKIANALESPVAGVLRRRVASDGDMVPVGALLGVVCDRDVPDATVDEYVRAFEDNFVPADVAESDASAEEFVEAGGKRICRIRSGPVDGPAILMIHGFGADKAGWMFNQPALAENHNVHAIDLPGHGGSVKDVPDGSVEALAGAVTDYMDAEDLDRAHLVGHSLGGAIAAEMALVAPARVSGLSLLAPAGFGDAIAGDFIAGFIGQSRGRKLRPFLEMLVEDPELVSAEMVEDVLKFKRLDGALAALQTIAAANFSGDRQNVALRERLPDIEAPVQVIWGEGDRILAATHADGLPDTVQVSVIPEAGHIVHMEKSGAVNRAILDFIS